MDLTPQDLWMLRNIAIKAVKEVHEVLAEAARRSRKVAREPAAAPKAPPAPTPTSPSAPDRPREPRLSYTIKDAGAALSLSRSTLYKLIADGELATIRIGSRRLIAASELEALLSRSGA